jgi:hypothetical protein
MNDYGAVVDTNREKPKNLEKNLSHATLSTTDPTGLTSA